MADIRYMTKLHEGKIDTYRFNAHTEVYLECSDISPPFSSKKTNVGAFTPRPPLPPHTHSHAKTKNKWKI